MVATSPSRRFSRLGLLLVSAFALAAPGCVKKRSKEDDKDKSSQVASADVKARKDKDDDEGKGKGKGRDATKAKAGKKGKGKKKGRRGKGRRGKTTKRPVTDDAARKKAEEKLSTMGYVDGMVDPDYENTGVIKHDEDRAFEGFNFYTSRRRSEATLIDMEGKVAHRWGTVEEGDWQHATLLPNGEVIVLVKEKFIVKYDKDSNEKWRVEGRYHHDLDVDDSGVVYALSRRLREDSKRHPKLPTVEDYVQVLSPDGEEREQISVLGAIEKSPYAFMLADGRSQLVRKVARANPNKRNDEYDILHTNHVEVLDGTFAFKNPAFKKGNLLISPRNIHSAIIVDPATSEIVWIWGASNMMFPHDPTVTEKGNLLFFNNGNEKTRSQVVEVDPSTYEIVWTYEAKDLYSNKRGSNQRLPNGNTLITESDTGYVMEVTVEGDVVWKFANPAMDGRKRMAIWRMWRYTRGQLGFKFNGGTIAALAGKEVGAAKDDDAK